MIRFSLIIATLGRSTELEELFGSLASQHFEEMECIVVDQNQDDRLVAILDRWSETLRIRRIRSTPGLSRARNAGLQVAGGQIVAFPDDDCWYTPSLLKTVSEWFSTAPQYSILTVGARDRCGVPSGNRWITEQCDIRPMNVFRTTFSSTIFVRRSETFSRLRFDERLGVGSGTPYSSGEETDFILELLRKGERGHFNRTLYIGHPKRDMLSGQVHVRRARGYGQGMGYVLRKQSLGALALAFVAYDLFRAIVVTGRGDFEAAALCLHHGLGVMKGYVTGGLRRKKVSPKLIALGAADSVLVDPVNQSVSGL